MYGKWELKTGWWAASREQLGGPRGLKWHKEMFAAGGRSIGLGKEQLAVKQGVSKGQALGACTGVRRGHVAWTWEATWKPCWSCAKMGKADLGPDLWAWQLDAWAWSGLLKMGRKGYEIWVLMGLMMGPKKKGPIKIKQNEYEIRT